MALVHATCNNCGDIPLDIDQVSVRICRGDRPDTYLFTCEICNTKHEKTAGSVAINTLVAAGAERTFWSVPQERIVERIKAPLTHDEAIEFHDLLGDDTLVADAVAALRDEAA